MFRRYRHWSANLLVAALAALVAVIARSYLSVLLQEQVSILIFIPAIAFAAWFGGFFPGMVATVLTAVAQIVHPRDIPGPVPLDPRSEEIRILLLVGTGLLISMLYSSLRRVRRGLERRYDLSQLMLEAARRLSGTLVVEELHDGLREMIARAIPFDGMLVSAYDPDTRVVRCVYGWVNGHRFDHTALPPLTIDLEGNGMQTEVIPGGKARLYADVRARVRRPGRYYDVEPDGSVRDLSQPGSEPPGARCALMAPLTLEGRVVGIVQVMSDHEGTYNREHLAALEAIVAPIAVSLQNAELYARAKREIAERLRMERALTLSEEQLIEADRRKDEVLATLAHELRNPLAPIRTAVALVRRRDADPAQTAWSGEVIERQVSHMARLLDDLLDVSRVSRGRLRLRTEPVDLADVIRHATESSQPLIEAGRHPLSVELPSDPIRLEADPTRLAQVFSNILNNAARYSEAGRPIRVCVEREGSEAVVRVHDQGIGIPPEMLPRIFEAFLQLDRSLERSQGGLGIGLTLVKQIVELHAGRVEAQSDGAGKGSVFTVRLPVPEGVLPSPRAADGPAEGATRVERKSGRRILVADDLEDSAASLAMLLQLQGYEVRTAFDGAQAVQAARAFRPDIVLLDIAMPQLNGYEAARTILAESGERRPRMIALTGWGHEENRMRTKEAGFDHHLVKPVEPETLRRLLEAADEAEARMAVQTQEERS